LLRQIASANIEIVSEERDLKDSSADTVIINTCGFIKDAKEESIEMILNAIECKKKGYIKRIHVFGCLSQRYGDELRQLMSEVDGFFGAFNSASVLEALGGVWNSSLNNRRYLTTPSHYAYLKISEGCDRVCSYCSIPLIRGEHRSVPIEELLDEAYSLAEMGVKELVVIAQDTTYYGVDIYKERRLAELLEKLSHVDRLEWIRLLYAYPAAFPESVLDVMASNPKICNYIDIPLQHINSSVLSNMRRSIDEKGTRQLITFIRNRVPGVVLRTTMITGHPGEDEKGFNELLEFVKETKFERLGAFAYSEEEGTWGAANLKDAIAAEVKQERLDRLMEVQSEISHKYNISRIGSIERVLIDYLDGDFLVGRSSKEAPEVDGEVLIDMNKIVRNVDVNEFIGKFADIKIVGADEYDLYGEILIK
jgi:ribosomal protein S12 methylthiotransferase RimO